MGVGVGGGGTASGSELRALGAKSLPLEPQRLEQCVRQAEEGICRAQDLLMKDQSQETMKSDT